MMNTRKKNYLIMSLVVIFIILVSGGVYIWINSGKGSTVETGNRSDDSQKVDNAEKSSEKSEEEKMKVETIIANYTEEDISKHVASSNRNLSNAQNEPDFTLLMSEIPMEGWAIVTLKPNSENEDDVIIATVLKYSNGGLETVLDPFPVRLVDYYSDSSSLPVEVRQMLKENKYKK